MQDVYAEMRIYMNIIAADDEQYALDRLMKAVKEAASERDENINIAAFLEPEDVIEYAKDNKTDVAFLDIEMGGSISGIDVARQLKLLNPKMNIIFVTAYDQYMSQAIKLRMSGYVEKPVTKEKILIELEDLKYPVQPIEAGKVVVRCFGNFEVFVDGKILEFEKAKTKEMLAYLIDRHGSSVTTGELRSVLWEDATTDVNTRSYLSKTKKDLVLTLKKTGIRDVFIETRGKYSIDVTKITCDYYNYINNLPDGIRAYNGEYMSQYSWGEIRNVNLQKN